MTVLTICMPVYNAEKYLDESIGSILRQSYSDFRLLLYNDGSSDGSLDRLNSFGDRRIVVIDGKENRGGIYARTQLINAVDTEYCMWLDDDDRYFRNDAVEYAMDRIRSGDYDMVNFTRILEVNSDGKRFLKCDGVYGDFSYCGDRLFDKFYPTDNHFIFNSKVFKSHLLKRSIPGEDILSRRFCTDDMFFSAMWFFHCRRYLHDASCEPILEYKKDIGLWGSHCRDASPDRVGKLCILQYNVFLSLYNRLVATGEFRQSQFMPFVHGVNLPMVPRLIKRVRDAYGDGLANHLSGIWHSAFAKDGVHLLNGVNAFEMPDYIRQLEDMMK